MKFKMNLKVWFGTLCVILISLSLLSSYGTTYYILKNRKYTISYGEQTILDTSFKKVTSLKPGQPFIYHIQVLGYNNNCWSDYSMNIRKDKIDYQFPIVRSRYLRNVNSPKNFNVDGYYELPKELPEGHYKFIQNSFPHCEGINVDPFQTDVNLEIDVKK